MENKNLLFDLSDRLGTLCKVDHEKMKQEVSGCDLVEGDRTSHE